MATRSRFRTISPDAGIISPGIIAVLLMDSLPDWVVETNELAAVREGYFHLYLVDHFWDAFHDLIASQDPGAFCHQLGNRLPVACPLHDEIRDKRDTLGIVELE